MTPEQVNDYATIIALAAAVPFAGYTVTYGLGSPWCRSLLGWVMFGLGASIVLVLAVVLGRRLFGAYLGYEWVAVTAHSLLNVAGWSLWAIVIVERRRTPMLELPLNRKAVTMTNTTEGVDAPVIWYKGKRVVRTIVQALVTLVPTLNGLALAASAYLSEQADVVLPGWVFLVLNGVIAVTALIMGLVARLMAVPGVNDWLVKVGLGSVPASAIEAPGVVAPDPHTR